MAQPEPRTVLVVRVLVVETLVVLTLVLLTLVVLTVDPIVLLVGGLGAVGPSEPQAAMPSTPAKHRPRVSAQQLQGRQVRVGFNICALLLPNAGSIHLPG